MVDVCEDTGSIEDACEVRGDPDDMCDDTSECARCTTQLEKTCEVGGDTGNVFDDATECECRHFIPSLCKGLNSGLSILLDTHHHTPFFPSSY